MLIKLTNGSLSNFINKLMSYKKQYGGEIIVMVAGHPGESGSVVDEANYYIEDGSENIETVLKIVF